MFGKGKAKEDLRSSKASDRIIFKIVNDNDIENRDLVLSLKDGNPLVLNFQELDEMAANKLLGFFIGATVALDGRTTRIDETKFMFARREELQDGSLQSFLAKL